MSIDKTATTAASNTASTFASTSFDGSIFVNTLPFDWHICLLRWGEGGGAAARVLIFSIISEAFQSPSGDGVTAEEEDDWKYYESIEDYYKKIEKLNS